MRKTILMLAGAALMFACTIAPAGATVGAAPTALRDAADTLLAIENAQFIWQGRRYCWYDRGWRGPGWYWCGHAWRRGSGWGGPVGWHGWRRPGLHRPPVHRPGMNRPGGPRPGAQRPGAGRLGVQRPGGGRPGVNRPGRQRPGSQRGAVNAGIVTPL